MAAAAVSLPQERPLTSLEEILLYAISHNLPLLQELVDPAHDRELDEQIAMGWGSTSQTEIPSDWRTRRGPERPYTIERRSNISQGMRRRVGVDLEERA
jgi:hypothetical protein